MDVAEQDADVYITAGLTVGLLAHTRRALEAAGGLDKPLGTLGFIRIKPIQ